MCGISGIFGRQDSATLKRIAASMALAISHRGPDGAGAWADHRIGLALGHRRLAVIDPSDAGSQPMHSACGRYVISFNGEIYNHLDLRQQLQQSGHAPTQWRGHADTETLLACCCAWGMEATLKAAIGMFAIALWDRLSCTLTLARDRMGEKPLYWGWQGNMLLFGSELKALKACPDFSPEIDRNALVLLLRHACIPAPHSIYQGIEKLRPGHFVQIPLTRLATAQSARPRPYWTMNHAVQEGLRNPFQGSIDDAVALVERTLSDSVRSQMIADVPLGAFLSGGIDSSTIAALMQSHSAVPIQTFTIGFQDKRYDEAGHAKAIARHLGTRHTELYVEPDDTLALVGKLAHIYDEPFADSSQIPTYLISQLARRHVTVALSGDAGDELFGGYTTYRLAPAIWSRVNRYPSSLRKAFAASLSSVSVPTWNKTLSPLGKLLPATLRQAMSGEKLHRLACVLPAQSQEDFYLQLSSHWNRPAQLVRGASEPATLLDTPLAWPKVDNFEHWMMAMNAQTYLADDILAKVDRASMANSLEVRTPMLDHRVVELAWRIPLELKIKNGSGKWLLREVLHRHVPRHLTARPKMGFAVPLASWLRGPLRDWAENLLSEQRLDREGYFDTRALRTTWTSHLGGRCDYSSRLWCVLMFQAWLDEERVAASASAL